MFIESVMAKSISNVQHRGRWILAIEKVILGMNYGKLLQWVDDGTKRKIFRFLLDCIKKKIFNFNIPSHIPSTKTSLLHEYSA